MKQVTLIKTSDGALYQTIDQAKHRAEERYGRELTRIANQIVPLEKYVKIAAFIDEHLEEFIRLHALKEDISLEPSDSD